MSVGAEPPISAAANRVSSVKPPMSVRTACGAYQAAHGRWKKERREQLGFDRVEDLLLVALAGRSVLAALHVFSRVRARTSAWVPLRWWTPGRRFRVNPPFWAPPLISEQIRPVLTVTPPIASMNFGKLARLTMIRWLIFTPVNFSTVLIASAGPPSA